MPLEFAAEAAEGAEAAEAAEALPEWVANTFDSGQYTATTLDQDMTVYRVDTYAFPAGSPSFYGTEMPGSVGEADDLYNITPVSPTNQMNYMNTYKIPAGATVYQGPVVGGTGIQMYLPSGGAQQIGTQLLPR